MDPRETLRKRPEVTAPWAAPWAYLWLPAREQMIWLTQDRDSRLAADLQRALDADAVRASWLAAAAPGDTIAFRHASDAVGGEMEERLMRLPDDHGEPPGPAFLGLITPAGAPDSERPFRRARRRLTDAWKDRASGYAPGAAPAAWLTVGVDNHDRIRRIFGIEAATWLIDQVSARLASSLPPDAAFERLGESRFGVVVADGVALSDLAERLRAAGEGRATAAGPAQTPAARLRPRLSVAGALHAPGESAGDPADAMLAALDRVSGRAVALPDSAQELNAARANERRTAAEIVEAMAENRLTIAFQPVVRAADPTQVAFHECLVRAVGRDGRMAPASVFMPAAEAAGLSALIDRRVLDLALRALIEAPLARLSVNVSAETLLDQDWLSSYEAAAVAAPTAAERLIVELTETSAIADIGRTRDFVSRVRAGGAAFALDDFGAGFTSLSHLRDLQADIVKIDGVFARDVAADPDNRALVRSMCDLARHFEMMPIAEFVRDGPDADTLRALGVEGFQGFDFGAPTLAPVWRRAEPRRSA